MFMITDLYMVDLLTCLVGWGALYQSIRREDVKQSGFPRVVKTDDQKLGVLFETFKHMKECLATNSPYEMPRHNSLEIRVLYHSNIY